MLTMQEFYESLSAPSQGASYLEALRSVTVATQTQIVTLASEFSWQSWGEDGNPVLA